MTRNQYDQKATSNRANPQPVLDINLNSFPLLARKAALMKFGVVRVRDEYEELELRLQRELTPRERRYLTLADEMIRGAQRKQALLRQRLKAA